MFCKHCGTKIEDNATLCHVCGKIVENDAFVENQEAQGDYFETPNPEPNYYDDYQVNSQKPDKPAGVSGLIFAIIGLEFACSVFLAFLGIIFSYVARAKINTYVERYGEINSVNKVAKILSKIGIILSWVMTGIFVLYLIVLLALI